MNPAGMFIMAAGLFATAGGALDWEWFMNHRKARLLTAILTRTGARIFYVALGLGMAVLGALITMGVVEWTT